MRQWFLARGYPKIVVNNQIDEVVFGRDQSVKKNLESDVPFLTTYYPRVKELRKLIRDLLLFYIVTEKFKRFSHILQSHLKELRDLSCILCKKGRMPREW